MKLHKYQKSEYRKKLLSALSVLLIAASVAGLWITFLDLSKTLKDYTLYQSYITEYSSPADHK